MRGATRPCGLRWFSTLVAGATILFTSGCLLHRKAPWEKIPLPPGGREVTSLHSGPVMDLERVRFYSRELGEPRFFLVLKPHGASRPLDVWVLNHGWADRPETLLDQLHVEATYSRLLAEGRVRPAVIVIPDVRFSNFYRVHSDRFPFAQYLALVAEEVAGAVADLYAVPPDRERWSIGGFSFGGYISLDVGRRYMGRFGSVSVVSSFYDPEWTFWPETAPPAGPLDDKGRGKQTIVLPGPPPRLMLACGEQDRFFGQMVALHGEFSRRNIPHEWSQASGGHTWTYWSSVLDAMFIFHLAPRGGAEPR
jgi:enterochelin esterase-like enzyme